MAPFADFTLASFAPGSPPPELLCDAVRGLGVSHKMAMTTRLTGKGLALHWLGVAYMLEDPSPNIGPRDHVVVMRGSLRSSRLFRKKLEEVGRRQDGVQPK